MLQGFHPARPESKDALMRISLLLPDMRGGGAERVNLLLLREFLSRGYDVDLVLLHKQGELLNQLPAKVRVIDLRSDRIRQAFMPLVRYLRDHRPDALLVSMWPLTTLAVIAAKVARYSGTVVVSEHAALTKSPVSKGWSGKVLRASMRWINWHANDVVGVSNGVIEDLHKLGLPAAVGKTIYNPIEISSNTTVPEKWLLHPWMQSPRSRRVIAVGSLKHQKDYPTLLLAIKKIVDLGREVSLLILGTGPLLAELEEQCRILGLERQVHFGGFVPDPGPFYRAAALFVLSSAYEGFGNVIVEAMAAGTPVVATDCLSGPAEILSYGQFGRLVPVGDETQLADSITDCLENPLHPSTLIERSADFLPDVIATQYLKVLLKSNILEVV